MADLHPFDRLAARISERSVASPDASWTARLLASGQERIAKKVVEEAAEVGLAAMRRDSEAAREGLVAESADLLYHLLVLWKAGGVTGADVWAELERRETQSGLAEKAARDE